MSNQPPPTSNHRSVTGLVTKLVGDGATYGFINDEIFFQQTSVTGGPASVGDQIYAECEYSAHLPIKWNATSVRIVKKGSGQQASNATTMSQPQQQHLQQQQTFNQSPGQVAGTYQQHRQQRMQRQFGDPEKPQDSNVIKQHPNPPRLLDQAINPGAILNVNDPRTSAFKQQNQAQQPQLSENLSAFQEQPMGPPKFAYTSQLGSAFIQNQFVTPPPFIAQQQGPPLLPQTQQAGPPLLPQAQLQQQVPQQHQNQANQRQNKQGGRFNNQGDKNENRANRRGNRNDRARSRDRDSQGNNRSQDDKRDRSAGRTNKRDDIPVRPSPPPHSSARSSTSVGSDRAPRNRRHYDAQIVPKTRIMINMNAYDMKQRCPSSIHVPSDLKEVIVNQYYRLDIKHTPKPIKFTIEKPKVEAKSSDESSKSEQTADDEKNKSVEEALNKATDEESNAKSNPEVKNDSSEAKIPDNVTPPSSKSDLRLNHKYGVKVMLLSLPDFNSIYRDVYGENHDSYNAESKSNKGVCDTISLLCNKTSNNGFSLIGGKFDPVLDGFVEGSNNEFERHGKQPDLIATCKRVVQEQTGLDLGPCKSWTLLSTFMYNNRSEYFSNKASVEYSFIYIPQIWTMASEGKSDKSIIINEEPNSNTDEQIKRELTDELNNDIETVEKSAEVNNDSEKVTSEDSEPSTLKSEDSATFGSLTLDNLSELKVADLKIELDKRNLTYKPSAKKAELASILREFLEGIKTTEEHNPDSNVEAQKDQTELSESLLESQENATVADNTETSNNGDTKTTTDGDVTSGEELSSKRKADDDDGVESETVPDSKRICTELTAPKDDQIHPILDSFIVHSREEPELTLVTLREASLAARHDQFELSVASNILRESLTQHFSEYILTALVEDARQRLAQISSGSNSSSQDSDTNNNKSSFKNPSADVKMNLKELPVDRYINLAFSYFDSSHMGYVYFEDLYKLFNNTGLTISKKALIALIGDGERYHYRSLPDLSSKVAQNRVYEFPQQFSRLPGMLSPQTSEPETKSASNSTKMIEHKGVIYDVEKLVQQVQDAEITRVNLYDRFNYAITNSDKQAEAIHVLEVNQKSLTKATKAQNDEICELKRERDALKKKLEGFRKGIKGAVNSLSDLVKE